MNRLLSWLGVIVFSGLLISGTYFVTRFVTNHPAGSANTSVPTLSMSSTLPPFPQGKWAYSAIRCDKPGTSNWSDIAEGCVVETSSSPLGAEWIVKLPEIKDMKLWEHSEVGISGKYLSSKRFDTDVYVDFGYADSLVSGGKILYWADVASTSIPVQLFDCDSNCLEIPRGSDGPPAYLVREVQKHIAGANIYLISIDKGNVQKTLVGTTESEGWTLGTACVGDPCYPGMEWGKVIDEHNVMLKFERYLEKDPTTDEPQVETKYILLELK